MINPFYLFIDAPPEKMFQLDDFGISVKLCWHPSSASNRLWVIQEAEYMPQV
jgi:hypothetical protein